MYKKVQKNLNQLFILFFFFLLFDFHEFKTTHKLNKINQETNHFFVGHTMRMRKNYISKILALRKVVSVGTYCELTCLYCLRYAAVLQKHVNMPCKL